MTSFETIARADASAAVKPRAHRKTISKKQSRLAEAVNDPQLAAGRLRTKGISFPRRIQKLGGTVLVVNKGNHIPGNTGSSISFVDLESGETRTIATPDGPHEIAPSPDQKWAIMPHYGTQPQEAGAEAGGGNSISLLSLRDRKLRTISVAPYFRPHGVEWLDNDFAAVTVEGTPNNISRGSVLVINVTTGNIEHVIDTAQAGSHLVRKSSDGQRLFVTNIQGQSLSVIKKTGSSWRQTQLEKVIPAATGTEAIDLHPQRNEVWIANQQDNSIYIIDQNSLEVKRRLHIDGFPIRLKFTPDQKTVVVTLRQDNRIALLDVESGKVRSFVNMTTPAITAAGPVIERSSVPMMVSFHPQDSNILLISNSHAGLVSIVDIAEGKTIGYLKAGAKPDPLVLLPKASNPAGSSAIFHGDEP